MKIARVFPVKTNYCPTDKDCYFDCPDMFTPKDYDEIHISVTFTWDIPKASRIQCGWGWLYPPEKIRLGGVAIDGESDKPFMAGMYLKKGITITSRGCPNNCKFCMVRRGLIEFDEFPEGNIIQDNNILACSDRHWQLVMSMLRKQKAIMFKGGLEKYRITSKVVEDLRSLRIKELWLSCDLPNQINALKKAVKKLQKVGFTRGHLHCYVLIGDDIQENENRLREIWNIGCMPFAQLYQPIKKIDYSREWKRFARAWSKPAIIRSRSNHDWLKWN